MNVWMRMLRGTFSGRYGFLDRGDEREVDDETGRRWARRRIAEVIGDGRKALQGDPQGHAAQTQPGEGLAEKTRNELVKLAAAAKVAGYGHMTKAQLIEALRGGG